MRLTRIPEVCLSAPPNKSFGDPNGQESVMSDWLSHLEDEKVRKETAERLEAERKEREEKEAFENELEHELASYERNRTRIDEIYETLLSHVKRAEALGFRFRSAERHNHTLSLEWGPHKSFTLAPDGEGFDGVFFDLYDNRNVHVHKHIPLNRITEDTLLDWVKWLAKGEGRPWKQW